ncbi:MAG: glucokinase [Candidatus Peregrinibacteria bacterium Gr01-1014_25]|nr:MAG: glucokinase [Candidatus Peregrinibacteria bacterium Gr01-1014_25]
MPAGTILGFDLGGTKSSVSRYDAETWELHVHERLPTQAHRGWDVVLEDVLALIEKVRRPDTIAIGIGIPGLVRQPEGSVVRMPNIPGADDVPLKAIFEKRIGLPVSVDNDANCFTLAEAQRGAGKGHSVVIGITMGTGVGGGIVAEGRVFRGAHGFAGEIGHMLLQPGQPPFATDDKRGDVEQFLSGTAFGKRCSAAKRPEDYLEGEVCSFLQPQVFREIAWMCVSLLHVIDPSIIVFGGSAGKALKPHLSAIEHELRQWALPGTPLPELAIERTQHAATLGAALLTCER